MIYGKEVRERRTELKEVVLFIFHNNPKTELTLLEVTAKMQVHGYNINFISVSPLLADLTTDGLLRKRVDKNRQYHYKLV